MPDLPQCLTRLKVLYTKQEKNATENIENNCLKEIDFHLRTMNAEFKNGLIE